MNKSSSFYSEAYYEKARKQAYKKKAVYRQRHKELYDQQHELEVQRYYHNTARKCQMLRYFQLLNEVYLKMRDRDVRKNEDYMVCVEEFIAQIKHRIGYFHGQLMSQDYLTKSRYMALALNSPEGLCNYWIQRDLGKLEGTQVKGEANLKREMEVQGGAGLEEAAQAQLAPATQQGKGDLGRGGQGGYGKRLITCNLCPIFIEQFEFNFEKALSLIIKNCEYWEQLNGHQKISKYRSHIQQNLSVLKHQLQTKCEYSSNKDKTKKTRIPTPRR